MQQLSFSQNLFQWTHLWTHLWTEVFRIDSRLHQMIVTVEDSATGKTAQVDASTATALINVARDLFGSGILQTFDDVVMSVDSNLVAGNYKWIAKAVGENWIWHACK